MKYPGSKMDLTTIDYNQQATNNDSLLGKNQVLMQSLNMPNSNEKKQALKWNFEFWRTSMETYQDNTDNTFSLKAMNFDNNSRGRFMVRNSMDLNQANTSINPMINE